MDSAKELLKGKIEAQYNEIKTLFESKTTLLDKAKT